MFKVGEYYEDEAKTVANYLKDAGFKVDIRGLVLARTDFSASLQGKLSVVKEKTEIAEREQYLSALKNALEKGATSETFEDLFLEEVVPGWKESVAKFRLLQENDAEIVKRSMKRIKTAMPGPGRSALWLWILRKRS